MTKKPSQKTQIQNKTHIQTLTLQHKVQNIRFKLFFKQKDEIFTEKIVLIPIILPKPKATKGEKTSLIVQIQNAKSKPI